MYLESYDSSSGNPIENLSELDFGSVIQGQHCYRPLVIKAMPDVENNITDLKLFLENKNGGGEYGYYVDSTFIPSIKSGGPELQDHFVETPDASSTSPHGIDCTAAIDYIWLDVSVPSSLNDTLEPNFRFIYNYS